MLIPVIFAFKSVISGMISLGSVSYLVCKYQLFGVGLRCGAVWCFSLSCFNLHPLKKMFSILCKPNFASRHLVLSWLNITLFLLFLACIWMQTKDGGIHKSNIMLILLGFFKRIRFSNNIYPTISQILLSHGNDLWNLFNKCCNEKNSSMGGWVFVRVLAWRYLKNIAKI